MLLMLLQFFLIFVENYKIKFCFFFHFEDQILISENFEDHVHRIIDLFSKLYPKVKYVTPFVYIITIG